MKKFLLAALFAGFVASLSAQNIQLHYDLGENRSYFTTTVEMFKPDKYGSTFFFIDMDYGSGGVEGVSLAYWEIARAFKLSQTTPLALHVEYNGGMGQFFIAENTAGAYSINSAWLGGLEYSWNAQDFSRGFTLQTLYKNIRGKHDFAYQLTGVWYVNFANNRLSFNGFADFWREDNVFNLGTNENPDYKYTDFVFLAEPQLWYNFNKTFSIGSEVEISSNFGGLEGVNVMPTVAVKWTL